MNNIIITDLFGSNNISNDTKVLCLSGDVIDTFLVKIMTVEDLNIYKPNYKNIVALLRSKELDHTMFGHIGHYVSSNEKIIIYLVNKKFGRPVGEFKVSHIKNNVHILTPSGNGVPLSLVVKDSELDDILLFPEEFTTQAKYDTNKNDIYRTSLGTLGWSNMIEYKFDRSKLYDNYGYSKFVGYDGTYLAAVPGSGSELPDAIKLRSKSNRSDQIFNYNANGELQIDNKCITIGDKSLVYLANCVNDIKQKWYPYGSSLISQYDDACISSLDNDSLEVHTCDNSDGQRFSFELVDATTQDDYKWGSAYGKHIILTDAKNPWFINKENTELLKSNEKKLSNCPIKSYDFGKVEHFNEKQYNVWIYACITIVITILLYYIVKYVKKNKSS